MDGLRSDAARNRGRILDAARSLVTRGDAPALNAVAKAAGVGVATVYRHFATVDELEEALVWEKFDDLASVLHESQPPRIEPVLTALFELMVEDTLFQKVTARASPVLERTAALRASLTDQLQEIMDHARLRGTLRADIDAAGAILLVCALASAVRSAGVTADSPRAHALLRVVLDGLEPADRPSTAKSDTDPGTAFAR
ncbi:TetR/AcrR family transcriptional regulator [Marinactinospora endophytica]